MKSKRGTSARERERATENKGSMKHAPPSSGASDIMVMNCAIDRVVIELEFRVYSLIDDFLFSSPFQNWAKTPLKDFRRALLTTMTSSDGKYLSSDHQTPSSKYCCETLRGLDNPLADKVGNTFVVVMQHQLSEQRLSRFFFVSVWFRETLALVGNAMVCCRRRVVPRYAP